ncbi:MAG: alpha/beta fold hydrolase [Candidatus Nanopelagicales bacterium]|nr:alpha/beta fold hydrolase [Candidatus Nanopelagicales bacterium]
MITDQQVTSFTADGVRISASHAAGPNSLDPLAFVVVHGFTGGWCQERVQKVVGGLRALGGVVAVDMRGHGQSAGLSTLGMDEVLDVAAAVTWARGLGYQQVVTVGFSLGGWVVLREAALYRETKARVDAVVSVSGTVFWYYRGTPIMRLVHRLVETKSGRVAMRIRGVRIGTTPWPTPPPIAPVEAAAKLGEIPMLVVHGTVDSYFPIEHAHALYRAAIEGGSAQSEEWIIDGFGHAESAIDLQTIDDIGQWAVKHCEGEQRSRGGDEA